jgi:putative protein kinase ArgK-like GTPase of G3E family
MSSEYPDGLTEAVIDGLVEQAYAEAVLAPGPTSALADGSARGRRCRRIAHRAVAVVVRSLPVGRSAAGSDGEVAA